jgi:hypothetical protein
MHLAMQNQKIKTQGFFCWQIKEPTVNSPPPPQNHKKYYYANPCNYELVKKKKNVT